MVKVVTINKKGMRKTLQIKKFQKQLLYKKCNFKDDTNFGNIHTWEISTDKFLTLYAKCEGKAGMENKYDLPPPMDIQLFFGTMLLILHKKKELDENELLDLTKEDWDLIYDKLMGGFECLDDEEESEEEYVSPQHLTKEGYSKKDGVIVDEDDDDENIDDDDKEDSEEEYNDEETTETTDSCDYSDGSELSEEEYNE